MRKGPWLAVRENYSIGGPWCFSERWLLNGWSMVSLREKVTLYGLSMACPKEKVTIISISSHWAFSLGAQPMLVQASSSPSLNLLGVVFTNKQERKGRQIQ